MRIVADRLQKQIGSNQVLSDVSFLMESGHIYGLKGCNGSGKTMLMRCLCGLIYPSGGKLEVDGKQLGRDLLLLPSVGALIESPAFLPEYTGFQNLRFLADLQGDMKDETIQQQLQNVGLDPKDKRRFREYSLGMRQKLGIAAALLGTPQLIILDEPMNAIEEETKPQIRENFLRAKQAGAIVVLADHNSAELESCCDEILELAAGKIVRRYCPNKNSEMQNG